jgi:small subunit ribosomal protein S6
VALREYEIMAILDPEADEQTVAGVVDRITQILSEREGEVSNVDRWGRRKLAYEINRKSEGNYVLVVFKSEPEALAELDRVLNLADEVIRFKIIRKAA